MKKCLSALLALLALALPLGAVAQELEVMVIDGAAAPVEEQQLTTESAIRIPDDCIIDGPWARWYSDKAISQGSGFVYLDTQENGAESLRWDFPVDTHTPLLVKMNFTNMSHEETKLLSRVSCEVIYDDKYIFETTPMQVNPEQTDAEGVTGASASIDGAPLPPLFEMCIRDSFISARNSLCSLASMRTPPRCFMKLSTSTMRMTATPGGGLRVFQCRISAIQSTALPGNS